jgi:hypothetical protein
MSKSRFEILLDNIKISSQLNEITEHSYSMSEKVLIKDTSSFIGFLLSYLLLIKGFKVDRYDCITDYYDEKIRK